MRFTDAIFSLLWDIASWFWQLYYESQDIPIVGAAISTIFLALYRAFWNLLTPIAQFGDWANDVSARISAILSQADIFSLLRTWLSYAENAWSWVINAWPNLLPFVNSWWSSTSQIVLVWLSTLKADLKSYINDISLRVNSLTLTWDSFKPKIPAIDAVLSWWSNLTGNILLAVNTWWRDRLLDVAGLIDSAFVTRQGLWAGWQDWRDQVTEFFTDPEQWVYKRLDSFFERFW